HDAISTATMQAPRRILQNGSCIIPASLVLSLLDGAEIHAIQQQSGRTQRTQSVAHCPIDPLVIFGAGFPAHAADETDDAGDLLPCVCRFHVYMVPEYKKAFYH